MPNVGSVNQIEPSDVTTTSFGELSRLPSNRSASTVIEPSYSVRVTRRPPCSQVRSRPCRSRVLPLAKAEGFRNILTAPVSSSHFMRLLLGMPLQRRKRPSPNQTGPSHQRKPVASRSTPALNRTYCAKDGSRISTARSGYRSLGCHIARLRCSEDLTLLRYTPPALVLACHEIEVTALVSLQHRLVQETGIAALRPFGFRDLSQSGPSAIQFRFVHE